MYMTRAEMAEELKWCMAHIDTQAARIRELEQSVGALQEELAARPQVGPADALAALFVQEPPPESEHRLVRIPIEVEEPVDVRAQELPAQEERVHAEAPVEEPVLLDPPSDVISEERITAKIRKNLEENPAVMATSYLFTPCKTCGVELKYSITRRDKPDYCVKCKGNFRKDKLAEKSYINNTDYSKSFYTSQPPIPFYSHEPGAAAMKKTCDTCVFGRKCKPGVEGVNGFYCGAEQALSCRPGIVGAKYQKEEYVD